MTIDKMHNKIQELCVILTYISVAFAFARTKDSRQNTLMKHTFSFFSKFNSTLYHGEKAMVTGA